MGRPIYSYAKTGPYVFIRSPVLRPGRKNFYGWVRYRRQLSIDISKHAVRFRMATNGPKLPVSVGIVLHPINRDSLLNSVNFGVFSCSSMGSKCQFFRIFDQKITFFMCFSTGHALTNIQNTLETSFHHYCTCKSDITIQNL